MGVTVLQQYPVKDRTGPQTIDSLSKRIVALGAKQCGQFLVDCETHVFSAPMTAQQRTVHVLHNSEQPASVFSILESGSKTIPVVADTLFDLLIMKMNTIWSKKQTRIESRGARYELCDFCIKIGSVTMSQNFKGVLLEIEYKPCLMASNCWDFMKEFIQGLLGTPTNAPPQYLLSRMNDIYQPLDTVQQYLEHFGMFRKATGILQYS